MKNGLFKKSMSVFLAVLMLMSAWVFVPGEHNHASAANEAIKEKYLFAYFTDNSAAGQTIHLAVSEDGLNYTALRNNEPVIIPSKGTGAVRDPYLWYNEQDNYYYIIATDMDCANGWWDVCDGFMLWRSKDLVHWYDETYINVCDLLQGMDVNVNIVHRAWAPQILWDGTSYVVYFAIDTDNANAPADPLSIVYLKTTDLMDTAKYHEYGGIYYPGSDVNDADIIQHPTNGKWYMFYKPEAVENGPASKIYMLQSDNATGPYTSPVADERGLDIYAGVNEGLEGGNGFFDNNGNFVMYADAYGHGTSFFYVATTSATGDFMNWQVLADNAHNINSLSPRHGSVVKITTEEYNRLLAKSDSITSSSYSSTETLEDHLVARYFTTSNAAENAVAGKAGLSNVTNVTMGQEAGGEWYAFFNSGYATVNLGQLFTEDLNYEDGFSITFNALMPPESTDHQRIFEIHNGAAGSRTGREYYAHFSATGRDLGSYMGVYNGPAMVASGKNVDTHGWYDDINRVRRNDNIKHEYLISFANGNVIVYIDGEVAIKRNRFEAVAPLNDDWFKAIGDATMMIGRSGWYPGDADLKGYIQDLCIYDCSMSYYDLKEMEATKDIEYGVSDYSGISSVIPTFANANATQMSTYNNDRGKGYPYEPSEHYSNIVYTVGVTGTPSGKQYPSDYKGAAAAYIKGKDTEVALYYSENTVILLDGKKPALIPVLLGARVDASDKDRYIYNMYPTTGSGSNADNTEIHLNAYWNGWTASDKYWDTIQNPDGAEQQIGYKAGNSGKAAKLARKTYAKNRDIYYYANTLQVDEDNINFNGAYYKNFNLTWQWYGGSNTTYTEGDAVRGNMTSDHNIYVIDYRPVAERINEFDTIVASVNCRNQYFDAYYEAFCALREINPTGYDYASNTATAVASCASDIQTKVAAYNTAKTNLLANSKHETKTYSAVAATCTKTGLKEGSQCLGCGEIFVEQEITAALGHNYVTTVTAPTCTAQGYTTHTCSRCNDSYVDTYVNAKGHTWTDATCTAPKTCSTCGATEGTALGHTYTATVTAPTCTDKGYTTHTCSRCNDSYVDTYVNAKGHTPGAAATCTTAQTCTKCGVVLNAATGHTWTPATCTAPKTCSTCGATEGNALGHLDANNDHVCERGCGVAQGTCSDSATDNDHLCDYGCGKVLEDCSDAANDGNHKCDICDTDNVTGHTKGAEVKENIEAETCSKAGKYDSVYYCTECTNEVERTNITVPADASKHSWNATTYIWSADGKECTATHTCAYNTEHKESETVTAVGAEKTPASCSEMGWTTYTATFTAAWIESKIQTKDIQDIATIAHTWDDGVVTTDPTCITDGVRTYTCSVCKNTRTEAEAATGVHSYGAYEKFGETTHIAKCNADAACAASIEEAHSISADSKPAKYNDTYHDYECEKCGERGALLDGVFTRGFKEEHTWVEDTSKRENETCTTDGKAYYNCSACEATKQVVISAAHKLVKGETVAPTCTTEGYTVYTCSVCGEVEHWDKKVALGHDFDTTVTAKDATCTADGNEAYKQCKTCSLYFAPDAEANATDGTVENGFIIGKLGHKFTEIEAKPATCTANGNEAYNYCETCKLYFAENAEKYAANGAQDNSAYIIESKGHTPAEAVKENIVQATCDADGSYNDVVYCSVETCKEKISTTPKTILARGHDMGDWYYADETDKPTYNAAGTQTRACKNTTESEDKLYAACNHTETRSVDMLEDSIAPTGKIGYGTSTWDKFLENITFGIYVSDSVELTITADDAQSGVAKIEYYISDKALTEAAVKALADTAWTAYTEKVTIKKNEAEKLVAYAKITDKQGNVTYLSTDGAVFDNTAPVIASDIGCTSATITITEANIQSVTVNGAAVTLTDGEYTVNGVGEHKVVVTDKVGKIAEVTVVVEGHTYTSEVTAPTCTTDGYTTYTCTACGDTYKDNEVDALGHKWTDANCETPKTCSVCKTTEGEALGHDWKITYNFAEDGKSCSAERVCQRTDCKAKETATATITSAVKTAATCTVDGWTTYTAKFDKDWAETKTKDVQDITAPGHTLTKVEAKAPTCTEDGCKAYEYCSACNYTTYEVDPKTGHNYEAEVTEATCTAGGYTTHTCTKCSDSYTDNETEQLGHSFTEFVKTVDYTCTEQGYDIYKCLRCEATENQNYKQAAHRLVQVEAKAPTCTEDGYKAYEYCSACNYTTYEVDAAKGHTEETLPGKAATCKETGLTDGKKCSVCGEVLVAQQEIAKTEHKEKVIGKVPATCQSTGSEGKVVCEACGITIREDKVIPKTPHEFGEAPVKVIAATCTSGKISIYKCKFCGAENRVVDKDENGNQTNLAPHTVVEVERVEPTCDTVGYYSTFCTVCGTQVETEIIPATGHSDENNDGVCDNCGGKYYNGNNGNGVCGCICHKEGVFMRFIYKIIRFFWKLLGIGKSCSCGAVHY